MIIILKGYILEFCSFTNILDSAIIKLEVVICFVVIVVRK